MNNQFKELWEQAEERRVLEDGSTRVNFMHVTRDKFAELIIQECANFLKDTMDDSFAAEQLLDHFEDKE